KGTVRGVLGLTEACESLDSDHGLLETLHPFAGDFGAVERNTGHVAPRTRKACDKAGAQRIRGGCQDNGNAGRLPFRRERRWCADDDDSVGSEARKLCRKLGVGLRLTEHEPVFGFKGLIFDVAKGAKSSEQCLLKVKVGGRGEITQTRRPRNLLRGCRDWPRDSRAAEQRDERAAVHSITSSARASSVGGTSRPSACAVIKLTTSS